MRFEIDDIREATAYCESHHREGEDVAAANGGCRQEEGSSHEEGIAMEEPVQTRETRSMSSLGDGEAEDDGHQTDEQDSGREREREWEEEYDENLPSSPVTINPPHPPWDDNSHPDQPYQNPYYVLPIKDALWLPMNPIGTLDLDMTVTMSVSLTSEPGAGRLGPPTETVTTIGSVLSGLPADLESAISVDVSSPDDTEAIAIQEALKEEREALQQSQLEAEKQKTPRSKWTSWAFGNRE